MTPIERFFNPPPDRLPTLLARPPQEVSVAAEVKAILDDVRDRKDEALWSYTRAFEHVEPASLAVSRDEISHAASLVDGKLKLAIDRAKRNIERFHAAQKPMDEKVETEPGVYCWRKSVPLERVGIYAPGGSAPLFSTVLMLAVPAHLAGCRSIVLCTPAQRDGKVHPAVLYAASISNVTDVFCIGGAQAIGAMAYGTESVPKVDKIFGPGNRFVTEAKIQVASHACAIDMPAGPSEVMVVVDASSDPSFAAADMLSQAEHGSDSQAILVVQASDELAGHQIADAVETQLGMQLASLPRKEIAQAALSHSKIIIVTDEESVIRVVNTYAPEHLLLQTIDFSAVAAQVVNAGSVFLGSCSCESAGDYASGTNHTLPTYGWARSYGGVSLDSYQKKITFQRITRQGLRSLGPVIETMALAESLDAHARAVRLRLDADGEAKS